MTKAEKREKIEYYKKSFDAKLAAREPVRRRQEAAVVLASQLAGAKTEEEFLTLLSAEVRTRFENLPCWQQVRIFENWRSIRRLRKTVARNRHGSSDAAIRLQDVAPAFYGAIRALLS